MAYLISGSAHNNFHCIPWRLFPGFQSLQNFEMPHSERLSKSLILNNTSEDLGFIRQIVSPMLHWYSMGVASGGRTYILHIDRRVEINLYACKIYLRFPRLRSRRSLPKHQLDVMVAIWNPALIVNFYHNTGWLNLRKPFS